MILMIDNFYRIVTLTTYLLHFLYMYMCEEHAYYILCTHSVYKIIAIEFDWNYIPFSYVKSESPQSTFQQPIKVDKPDRMSLIHTI